MGDMRVTGNKAEATSLPQKADSPKKASPENKVAQEALKQGAKASSNRPPKAVVLGMQSGGGKHRADQLATSTLRVVGEEIGLVEGHAKQLSEGEAESKA